MSHYKSNEKLELRVISLKGVTFQRKADAVQLKLADGLMIVNKNSASTVEKLFACKAIIFDDEKQTNLELSDGWLVMDKNKCDLFVNFSK